MNVIDSTLSFAAALRHKTIRETAQPVMQGWWREALRAPVRTGAVMPSGQQLCQLMARVLPLASTGPVIELGPGTGVITSALLRRRTRAQDLIAIEFNPIFAQRLASQFPSVEVLIGRAENLEMLVDLAPLTVAAVVSGLPLRNMKPRSHYRILSGAFRLLSAKGIFVQFTYGPLCPVSSSVLLRLGLKATKVGTAWRNLPPATVWQITRA